MNRTSLLPKSAVKPAAAVKTTQRSSREPIVSQAWADHLAAHLAKLAAKRAAAAEAALAAQAAVETPPAPTP